MGTLHTSARQHDLQRMAKPFENLAQCAVDQTFAEIKHDPGCRLRLLRQNRLDPSAPKTGVYGSSCGPGPA